jgi:hypothetical protein
MDAAGDARCSGAWQQFNGASLDEEAARQVRQLAMNAQVPEVAARAMIVYLSTPPGKLEAKADHGRGLLEEYLRAALERPEGQRDELLRGLVTVQSARDQLLMLAEYIKPEPISVTKDQHKCLKIRWEKEPKLLTLVTVREE